MSRVRELAWKIVEQEDDSNQPALNDPQFDKVAQLLASGSTPLLLDYREFLDDKLPGLDFEEVCRFFLAFNAINYCYFDEDGIRFSSDGVSGSVLLMDRMADAWSELSDPRKLSEIDENFLMLDVLKTPISLYRERVLALRELGKFFLTHPDFSISRLFKKYRNSLYLTSQAIPFYLPTWRDPFFKRAQLLVAMIYGFNNTEQDLELDEQTIEYLTVFADYRVPQTLSMMRLMNTGLEETPGGFPKQTNLIPSGSLRELRIRARSIVVADQLLEKVRIFRGDTKMNILHLDNLLWSFRRNLKHFRKSLDLRPVEHHLTMSTDY